MHLAILQFLVNSKTGFGGLNCDKLTIWLLISSVIYRRNFIMTSKNNHSQYSPLCVYLSFSATDKLPRDVKNSFDTGFEERPYWNASLFSQSALQVSSQQKPSALALWGTTSTSCEFLSQQTPLCSAYSSCHQTPILFQSGDLWWKRSLRYLCQLTIFQLLLFPLLES